MIPLISSEADFRSGPTDSVINQSDNHWLTASSLPQSAHSLYTPYGVLYDPPPPLFLIEFLHSPSPAVPTMPTFRPAGF
jgi:hypothetical protein